MRLWKKTALALSALVLLLSASGCAMAAQQAMNRENCYALYFQLRDLDDAGGEDAIRAESSGISKQDGRDSRQLAEAMLELLLDDPVDDALRSPFPAGTAIRSVTVQDGRAAVDLSMAYSSLSGVHLSMADYCVALTLTQLPDVRTVSITVGGQELAYRGVQILRAKDVLFSTTEDVVGTVDVTLYFLNEGGGLTGEPRTLNLYEGDTQAGTLVRALLDGPAESGLSPSLPEDFSIQAMWMEDGVCCVNLSSDMIASLPPGRTAHAALRALAKSLLSLKSVDAVRFLLDGQSAAAIGGMDVSHLIER